MDIRLPVGALFATYGVLLALYGFIGGDLEPRHMLGRFNVNVWDGVAMLVFGVAMLWLARRSPRVPQSTADTARSARGH